MKRILFFAVVALAARAVLAGAPALTIYNENFAVVRDTIHLDLKAGVNEVNYSDATMHLEPDSVVLRDPAGRQSLQILEQNYRADPVTQSLLLKHYEGQTIEFEVQPTGAEVVAHLIHGKIIRSGFVPHTVSAWGEIQPAIPAEMMQPIIEVDGKLMFRLPGEPLFPRLADDTILKPTLSWRLNAAEAGSVNAELGYVTSGMTWQASYNLVAPEQGDTLDLVGWVTIDNQTGKSFQEAKIKLMAGDVNKIQNRPMPMGFAKSARLAMAEMAPPVTEKAFDDYHLYTLQNATTLLDRETKQVEFIRANGIASTPIYIYDGAQVESFRAYGGYENIRNMREFGTESNPKVSVIREFMNAESNHLGLPLPKGRLRFYRRDADGQLEFTGENTIDHTPRGEKIRVTMGNAFDLVGERKRTNYHIDNSRREMDESFEIKVRNHKKIPAQIRVVEHLYRGDNWEITAKSDDFTKTESQTIEFHETVQPDAEQVVTYSVHYSW
jgi:hypothetical protein